MHDADFLLEGKNHKLAPSSPTVYSVHDKSHCVNLWPNENMFLNNHKEQFLLQRPERG